jgi:hypothetical protein
MKSKTLEWKELLKKNKGPSLSIYPPMVKSVIWREFTFDVFKSGGLQLKPAAAALYLCTTSAFVSWQKKRKLMSGWPTPGPSGYNRTSSQLSGTKMKVIAYRFPYNRAVD